MRWCWSKTADAEKAAQKHLVNLFDLEEVEVNDLMTPRSKIEALNINDDIDTIRPSIGDLLPQ